LSEDILAGLNRMLKISEGTIISLRPDGPKHGYNNFHEDWTLYMSLEQRQSY
jgi:hypothetical protein